LDIPERPFADGIRISTLSNGLLLITERLPLFRSVCLGLAFRLGGRDDPPDLAGLCHVNEHMVFKGTERLDARAISFAAESLGAELNAFTDKELTCFYGRFPSDQQLPVTGLLSEIVARPAFAPAELEKEKEVIAEEIRTGEEDPDSKAFSLAFEALYSDHPMGWPISGTVESVRRLEPEYLRRAYAERYHAGNAVAVAVGDVRHEELARTIEREFGHWPKLAAETRRPPAPVPAVARVATRKDLSQVYLCLAVPTFAYPDPRRHALSILNTAFGGGLSSRLFQRLRETEGLVYSVSSFAELFEDSGLLGIYFVADGRKLERCLSVLREEISKLRQTRLNQEEFDRALNMTKSSILLSLESLTSRMLRLARTQHLLGRVTAIDETLNRLNRLKLDDVNGLVDEILGAPGFHAGGVGPLTEAGLNQLLG
jgi:predicted Zn-dependent peptidase